MMGSEEKAVQDSSGELAPEAGTVSEVDVPAAPVSDTAAIAEIQLETRPEAAPPVEEVVADAAHELAGETAGEAAPVIAKQPWWKRLFVRKPKAPDAEEVSAATVITSVPVLATAPEAVASPSAVSPPETAIPEELPPAATPLAVPEMLPAMAAEPGAPSAPTFSLDDVRELVKSEIAQTQANITRLVRAELARQQQHRQHSLLSVAQDAAEEAYLSRLELVKMEVQALKDKEQWERILKNNDVPLRERIEEVDFIRHRLAQAEKEIAEAEASATQRVAEAAYLVAQLEGHDIVADLREEVERQKQAVADLPAQVQQAVAKGGQARGGLGLWQTVLTLVLVLAVGVAGILLPRQDAARTWETIAGDNLVADGSFETGTWQTEAGDCCNGNPGVAKCSLARVTDATDGRYALQLTSDNHCSCVAGFVEGLQPGILYVLSFDYKAVEGTSPVHYVFIQHTQDSDVYAPQSDNLNKASGWQHYQTVFAAASGVTNAHIYLYADSDGNTRTVNLFDNVRVAQLGSN